MQWTSRFFEVVIVASCNEYLSLPKKKKKKNFHYELVHNFVLAMFFVSIVAASPLHVE